MGLTWWQWLFGTLEFAGMFFPTWRFLDPAKHHARQEEEKSSLFRGKWRIRGEEDQEYLERRTSRDFVQMMHTMRKSCDAQRDSINALQARAEELQKELEDSRYRQRKALESLNAATPNFDLIYQQVMGNPTMKEWLIALLRRDPHAYNGLCRNWGTKLMTELRHEALRMPKVAHDEVDAVYLDRYDPEYAYYTVKYKDGSTQEFRSMHGVPELTPISIRYEPSTMVPPATNTRAATQAATTETRRALQQRLTALYSIPGPLR